MKLLKLASLGLIVSLITVGCSEMSPSSPNLQSAEQTAVASARGGVMNTSNTIVDIASSNSDFSILVQAVGFVGLAGTLDGNRQFTVFAPTNAAFVALLNDLGLTPQELFKPANKGLVTKILLYHVVPGERFSNSVLSASQVRTLAKEFAQIKGGSIGNSKHGYANIVAADIDASNGVVHVLNKVIIPPSLF